MQVEWEGEQAIHLTQAYGEAWLRMEAGGRRLPLPSETGMLKPAFFYPLWISFETPDAVQANEWLSDQNVTVLQPLTHHQDWGGTDIIIADPDDNAIEIVEYRK